MTTPIFLRFGIAVTAALLLGSCSQERGATAPASRLPEGNRIPGLQPGPATPLREVANQLEETDTVIGEGKTLFQQFNCSGCHASGGGAIGPALTDDEWIYGSGAGNVFATIMEGRPQGMPAFGGKIANEQAWKLAAYVRSLSKLKETPRPAEQSMEQPAQQQEALSDEEAAIRHGRDVFLQGPCALCHTIRGTRALATVGPDLTHVASRNMIAGILPNTRGNLAGWILNPQNLKPGTEMPPTRLEPRDLHALLTYFESLK